MSGNLSSSACPSSLPRALSISFPRLPLISDMLSRKERPSQVQQS
jgi:hypothetical protein